MNILKQKRRDYSVSQKELAEYLDVSRKTIQRLESGDTQPTPVQICLLRDLLGIDLEDWIDENHYHGTDLYYGLLDQAMERLQSAQSLKAYQQNKALHEHA